MHSTSPTKYHEKTQPVDVMTWDGSLVGAQYLIKWVQSDPRVEARLISNRFGDSCIEIIQPDREPEYLRPQWSVLHDGGDFRAIDPFRLRSRYEPDANIDAEAVKRVQLLHQQLQERFENSRESLPGPIQSIYKSFIDVLDSAMKGRPTPSE